MSLLFEGYVIKYLFSRKKVIKKREKFQPHVFLQWFCLVALILAYSVSVLAIDLVFMNCSAGSIHVCGAQRSGSG